jgi:hypothetical protein
MAYAGEKTTFRGQMMASESLNRLFRVSTLSGDVMVLNFREMPDLGPIFVGPHDTQALLEAVSLAYDLAFETAARRARLLSDSLSQKQF